MRLRAAIDPDNGGCRPREPVTPVSHVAQRSQPHASIGTSFGLSAISRCILQPQRRLPPLVGGGCGTAVPLRSTTSISLSEPRVNAVPSRAVRARTSNLAVDPRSRSLRNKMISLRSTERINSSGVPSGRLRERKGLSLCRSDNGVQISRRAHGFCRSPRVRRNSAEIKRRLKKRVVAAAPQRRGECRSSGDP